MIKLIRINNIAVLPHVELELRSGFTVLTGETGAGKSIVVDALGLLLGDRASAELVRTGEQRATVEAIVEMADARLALEPHGLPVDDNDVIIRREIPASGKGKATVNGALVPLAVLRDLSMWVAEIHGQHEPQGLLDPLGHLEILDRFAGLTGDVSDLAAKYAHWRRVRQELDSLRSDRREAERRREMLEFQATEIERAGLSPGEEEALRREKVLQLNAGRLATLSGEAYGLLYEAETAVMHQLSAVYRRLEELAAIDAACLPLLESKAELRARLEDVALFLRDYHEGLQLVPGRLDEIEARLAVIDRLKRKYGASIEEVTAFGQRCRDELEQLGNPEETEAKLESEAARLASEFHRAGLVVSGRRRTAGLVLAQRVLEELGQLAMERSRFEVSFSPKEVLGPSEDPADFGPQGLERAEFVLSPNPGEDLRPLARIASGGELSRLMLGLRTGAMGDAGTARTLVFDEVDAGIGGRVAEVVGRKLRQLAARHQVLCVTHLPQIAAQADHHFSVQKEVNGGRTVAVVRCLQGDSRIEELARMLGGEVVSDVARRHARGMLGHRVRDAQRQPELG